MTPALAESLFDLWGECRRQHLSKGWTETCEWVFSSSVGDGLNSRNLQRTFDRFIGVHIQERPHQALGGAYPGDLYTPSARFYTPPPELE